MESCVLLQTPSRHWCSAALQATLQNTCRRENFEKVEERSTAVRLPVSCFASLQKCTLVSGSASLESESVAFSSRFSP